MYDTVPSSSVEEKYFLLQSLNESTHLALNDADKPHHRFRRAPGGNNRKNNRHNAGDDNDADESIEEEGKTLAHQVLHHW